MANNHEQILDRLEREQKLYERMNSLDSSPFSEKLNLHLERLNRIDEIFERIKKFESLARKTLYPENISNFEKFIAKQEYLNSLCRAEKIFKDYDDFFGMSIVQREYLNNLCHTEKIFKDYDDLNSRSLATMERFSNSFGALSDNQQSEIMSVAFELGVPMIENLIEKNKLSAELEEKSVAYDIASRITVVEEDKAKSWISQIPKELTQAFFTLRRALYPVIHEQPTMICSLFIGISTSLFMRGLKEESVLYMAIAGLFWLINAWGDPDE